MWDAICSDQLRTVVRNSIDEIACDLQAMDTASLTPIALCEQALLYAYLGLDDSKERWHEKSFEYLNLAIERLSTGPPPLHKGLYGGLAGIGWMVQHTFQILSGAEDYGAQWDNGEEHDPLNELDRHILDHLNDQNILGDNYDLISGYVGIGIYWLERLPRQVAIRGVRQTLDALDRLSKRTPLGITWFTPPSLVPPTQIESAPAGYYNLGVAHGVPGTIGFLAQAATLEQDTEIVEKASRLFTGALKWLLAQQRAPDSISRFSCWTIPGEDCGDSRLSWCYGDLGIAAVLQFVARRTKNSTCEVEARKLIDHCTQRTLNNSVPDAPLCHGAIGNAHIYNRAYQDLRRDQYRLTAVEWISKGVAMRKPGVGVAGYYAWRPDKVPHEEPNASFLSGAVGVALALLSTIAPIEPQWDRMMLLSGAQLGHD